MISITVKFPLKPEFADDWPEISREFTEATRAEPGNMWFEWARCVDDPTSYLLTEAFDDDAAAAHVNSAHFATMREEFPTYLRTTPFIVSRQVEGNGWDRMGELAIEDLVVSASRDIAAPAARIFEMIADPSRQPEWDGNGNLGHADTGQRVYGVGDQFVMTNSNGAVRVNHVVEFEEGRLIAWMPSPVGERRPGHLWRWALEPLDSGRTRVTHTYDWSGLTDERRMAKARATTAETLAASLDRLAALAGG